MKPILLLRYTRDDTDVVIYANDPNGVCHGSIRISFNDDGEPWDYLVQKIGRALADELDERAFRVIHAPDTTDLFPRSAVTKGSTETWRQPE